MNDEKVAPWAKARWPDFAKRLEGALSSHPLAPEGFGKNSWLARVMNEHGADVTREAVRKWLSGITKPHPETMKILARVLNVELGWLSVGAAVTPPSDDQSKRNLKGATNFVSGVMQLNGISVAYSDDERYDFAIIVNAVQYMVVCRYGRLTEDGVRFVLPANTRGLTVIGVVETESQINFRMLRLTDEVINRYGKVIDKDRVSLDVATSRNGFKIGDTPIPEIRWLDNLDGEIGRKAAV